jgi:hypothetical protein
MHIGILLAGLWALWVSLVSGTALTYKLGANEKSCYFTYVSQKGLKVAFYFAVSNRARDAVAISPGFGSILSHLVFSAQRKRGGDRNT